MKEKRREVLTTENYSLIRAGKPLVLMYVVHEPDSIFAAALIAKFTDYAFRIVFTNRHDINYDITSHAEILEPYKRYLSSVRL